jgi:hypothetical protein
MNQQQRRERAAEVIGLALQLHVDTEPRRLKLMTDRVQLSNGVTNLMQRHDAMRTQLWILAAWHPSEQVRKLAIRLISAMTDCLSAAIDYAGGVEHPSDGSTIDQETAVRTYDDAELILGKLMRLYATAELVTHGAVSCPAAPAGATKRITISRYCSIGLLASASATATTMAIGWWRSSATL